MSTEFSWDKELHPHTPNRGWKIKRNNAIKAEMERLGITNKDITGGRYDNGKVTFTYVDEDNPKGSVTQPLPKDHWTETGKGKTGAERAEQAFKELEEEKNKRNMGGVMQNKPTGFKGHF